MIFAIEEEAGRNDWTETLLAAAALATLGVGPDGTITRWSPGATQMFDWHANEILGEPIAAILPSLGAPVLVTSRELGAVRRGGQSFVAQVTVVAVPEGWALLLRDVSEHATVERELGVCLARQAATFAQASDAMAVVDPGSMRLLEANERLCALFGRSAAELLGRPVVELLDPRELARVESVAASVLEGGRHLSEWRVRGADGGEVVIEVSACLLEDGRVLAIVRDVSERRRAEEERARLLARVEGERRWLRAVLDAVPVAVLLFDADGRLEANRIARELLGKPRAGEAGGADLEALRHHGGAPVPLDELSSATATTPGQPARAREYLVRRPDGAEVPVLGSTGPVFDGEGRRIGGVAVFQVVTELARREEALRANERLLDAIFELLPVGVWIADSTGRIVRNNPAGERIWGGARLVPASEFDVYEGWWADSGQRIAAEEWALSRALHRGETSIGELIRIRAFDGTFKTIRNSALPLRDDRGAFAGAIVVNEDVTELRAQEEAARQALRERDRVLGVVSHDLRGPVAGVLMAAQLLSRRAEREGMPWAKATLDQVARAARLMKRMISDLLDVASIESGRLSVLPEELAPEALVSDVVSLYAAHASGLGVELVAEDRTGGARVSADHDRILQVLSNLVGNALKFTPRGGRIVVRAEEREKEVVFAVADNGRGIPRERQTELFDRFWHADPQDPRSRGIGLALARAIVEAHGGRIRVESEPDRGATFEFSLRARDAETSA